MSGNLPDGCTADDIDRATGYGPVESEHDDLAEAKEAREWRDWTDWMDWLDERLIGDDGYEAKR